MNENIFNERIFGCLDCVKHISNLEQSEEPECTGNEVDYLIDDISIFDYILGNRLNFFPFVPDRVFHDWMGYENVSIRTLQKIYTGSTTVDELVRGIPVHQDLFFTMHDITLLDFFVALCIPPQPYRILCMQWDSFYELYKVHNGQTFDGRTFAYHGMSNSGNMRMSKNSIMRTPNTTVSNTEDLRDYNLIKYSSCENTLPVNINGMNKVSQLLSACKVSSIPIYKLFTSEIGLTDCRHGDVYNRNEYSKSYAVLYADNALEHVPSTWAYLLVSESFLSDAIGIF